MTRFRSRFGACVIASITLVTGSAALGDDFDDLGDLSTESKLAPFEWEPLITAFIVLPRPGETSADDAPKTDAPKASDTPGAVPRQGIIQVQPTDLGLGNPGVKPLKLEMIKDLLPSVKAAWDAIVPLVATRLEAYGENELVPSSFELRTETDENGNRTVSPYIHLAAGTDESPIQTLLASEDVFIAVNIDVLLTHADRDEILKNFEVMEMSVLAYRFPAEKKDSEGKDIPENIRARLGAPLPDARGDIDTFDRKVPQPHGVMMIGAMTNTNMGDRVPDAIVLLESSRGSFIARTPGLVEFRIRLRIRGTIGGVEQTKMASGAIRVRFTDQKSQITQLSSTVVTDLAQGKPINPKPDPGTEGAAAGGASPQ